MNPGYARCRSCGILFLRDGSETDSDETVCPGCRALARITGPHEGRVTWYDARKRYGFLETGDGKSVFLHASSVPPARKRLHPGTRVRFLIEMTARGPQATQVQLLRD